MHLIVHDPMIPGTVLRRNDMNQVTGRAFLDKVFFISDGVMLSQIRDISGIDGSTLQNWTKRGWVPNSVCKKYNRDQLAHILIINMLRSCMQLEHISTLIQYVNGDVDDTSDDIITDSELYDTICRCIEALEQAEDATEGTVHSAVLGITATYREPVAGARERLVNALEIILYSYCASLAKHCADERLTSING